MAAAERRRGRRDNGLDATDWRAIDDLDPRLSEYVLDLLASQGIAAYVQPAVDVDPVTRSATLPSPIQDRLFVDRRHGGAARESLRRFLAENAGRRAADDAPADPPAPERSGMEPPATAGSGTRSTVGASPAEIDATFADIVSRLEDLHTDPTAEPVTGSTTETAPEPPPTGPVDGRHVTEPSLLDALDTFGADLPDEDSPAEQFEPPPPPPLPRVAPQTVFGTLAALLGLVLVIGRPDVIPLTTSGTMLIGFALMLGGATALIMRLHADPEENHPDDGARL